MLHASTRSFSVKSFGLAGILTLFLSGCVTTANQEPTIADPPSDEAASGDLPAHSLNADSTVGAAPASDGGGLVDDALAALEEEDPFMLEGAVAASPSARPGAQVALLAPLSGKHAAVGKGLLEAAQLALFDMRKPTLSIMPMDTKGTPEGASEAAREAISRGADMIIGPLLAGSVTAVGPIARSADVPVLAFSNTPSVAGDGVYVMGFTPDQQVQSIIEFAVAEGITRFAVLAPRNAYGEVVVSAFQRTVAQYRASITRLAFVNPAETDYSDTIKRISDYDQRRRDLLKLMAELEQKDDEASRAALDRLQDQETLGDPDFQAILVPATSSVMLQTLAAQLAYYDVDQPAVRVLGLQLWDEFGNLSREPSLRGAWFAAPPGETREKFDARFQALYGRKPARLSWLAYDVTALAAVLAGDGDEPQYDEIALTNEQGFAGVEGIFRISPTGVADRSFEIREITGRGVRAIRPAPARFNALIN